MPSRKERPICRKAIVSRGLKPFLEPDRVTGKLSWNGYAAVTSGGERTSLSLGMRVQMRQMVAEGYFGPILVSFVL